MSHNHDTTIICPNCGHEAKGNYCYQCGQENHLHKDTFFGLIMHFVGHYFHYDSKFWKTLKMLWLKPGELTTVYREKKRMRYIPPISLYIFISAVFFLTTALLPDTPTTEEDVKDESAFSNSLYSKMLEAHWVDSSALKKVEEKRQEKLHAIKAGEMGKREKEQTEKMVHLLSKVFFFMIPFTALLLKLLFIRRKETYFVDHAVFSLHYHSFWFSLMFFGLFSIYIDVLSISDWVVPLFFLITIIYFVIALRKVYNIGIGRSIFYTLFIGVTYCIFMTIFLLVLAVGPKVVNHYIHKQALLSF